MMRCKRKMSGQGWGAKARDGRGLSGLASGLGASLFSTRNACSIGLRLAERVMQGAVRSVTLP